MPDHPKAIGDRSEAHALAALVDCYPTVLMPWGENCRYDFVIETLDGELLRVQCKTGHLRRGVVTFPTTSMTYHHPKHGGNGRAEHCARAYQGDADLFAVYCVENRRVYLVPVEDVPSRQGSLRLEPARNGQQTGIRWGTQYELHPPE
jgi:hypothetical protein